ncbi:MAG: universal stress protein [Microthrixaceae bacterium]
MNRVVVGLDTTSANSVALTRAVAEARLRGAELEVVSVWTYPPISTEERLLSTASAMEAEARERAAKLLADVMPEANNERPDVTVKVVEGPPARTLLGASEGARLLVVGRRDRARFRHLVLGSVADQCVRHASCPVMVVPEAEPGAPEELDDHAPLVVGVDGSDHSERALAWGMAEAQLHGWPVRAVWCWQEPLVWEGDAFAAFPDPAELEGAARAALDRMLAAADVPEGVELSGAVLRGDPGGELLNEARAAAMLVVGSRGRGGFAGLLLGSVARRATHLSVAPVVVLGPDAGW